MQRVSHELRIEVVLQVPGPDTAEVSAHMVEKVKEACETMLPILVVVGAVGLL